MPGEAEKRLHRCCFAGHRPEKLDAPEEVKDWLRTQIRQAFSDGYKTFICGMGMGADIMEGQIVQEIKETDPAIHLICVIPWPGFAARWKMVWKRQYDFLLETSADYVKYMSKTYHDGVFMMRNEYMVDHSNRLIAYYNGSPGGTWETIKYAVKQGIEIVTNRPELVREYRNSVAEKETGREP